jgi:hypothetical protein
MAGDELRKALECIGSNLESIQTGLRDFAGKIPDPNTKELNRSLALMIDGVRNKLNRAIDAMKVTDDSTLARIDNHVDDSHFLGFCRAFGKSTSNKYPRDAKIDIVIWGKWKDKIELWLESVETLLDEWSEVAEGSALQGLLKILSKAVTALGKAISATKDS